jgi:hypothetical protein
MIEDAVESFCFHDEGSRAERNDNYTVQSKTCGAKPSRRQGNRSKKLATALQGCR